jgi:uncharacterized membrane protein YoaK (UPF0700 family)
MRRYKITDDIPFRVQLSWFNLSFTAGAINAGGFLSCQRFVSHVTGFITISGLNFGQRAWQEALSAISIPAFFLLGAIISAFLTEQNANDQRLSKNFAWTMGIVSATLAVIVIFGNTGHFGAFGVTENIQADYIQIALLCMICGVQNAAVSSLTGSSVRPTHLTGTTTDIGIGFIRALRSIGNRDIHREEVRTNWRRVNLVIAFVAGVMVGSAFFFRLNYWGFALPLLTSLASMIESILDAQSVRSSMIVQK